MNSVLGMYSKYRHSTHLITQPIISFRDGALDELKRQENREGYNYNKENQKYRLLQYERAARVIREYPRRINLSCIDLEYGNKNIISKDKLSLEKSIACKRLIEHGTRLIRVGGSVYKRLIRAIILHEGSSGIYFRMLKDDPIHQIDEKLLGSKKATAILSFEKIWGVGIVSAVKIYRAGPSSISELRKNKDLVGRLNTQQQIGLNRYEDIMVRANIAETLLFLEIIVTNKRHLLGAYTKKRSNRNRTLLQELGSSAVK